MSIMKTYTSVRAMSNPTCEIGSQLMIWNEQSGGETFNVIYNGHVYQNTYWVERWHIPSGTDADSGAASPHNAWQWKRAATEAEKSNIGNPLSAVVQPIGIEGAPGIILAVDAATEATYLLGDVAFIPDGSGGNGSVGNLSYTASRVCNDMYNRYDPDPNRNDPDPKPGEPATRRPKVCAYITDWCQFDGRLDNNLDELKLSEFGRGFDLAKIPPTAYDKLIFSFLGVAGDTLFPGNKVKQVFEGWNSQVPPEEQISEGHIVPVDPYGDLGSSRNVGGGPAHTEISNANFLTYYNQESASGLLGGLRDLKDQARREGHNLELAFSIGGWSLSSYFSYMARTQVVRAEFIRSIVDFFRRFPMFAGIDIDWEYPGGGGLYDQTEDGADYHTYEDDDGEYYEMLISELRAALDINFQGGNRKEISIACSAVIAKMEKSNLKQLSNNGVDNIFLMSYDLFGTPWAPHIGHHTNLKSPVGTSVNTEEDLSADLAITYLIDLGIPASKINLGYANYGRSCTGANLVDRTYAQDGSVISLGTFEQGAPEFFDIVNNYFDLERQLACGKNTFLLYTDTTVDADFLYSNTLDRNHFISLDTPRTVKLKAEYAMSKGLGSVFSWSGDQDCGLLANAAREGAGYLVRSEADEKIDMGPLYNPGIPIVLPPVTELTDYVPPVVQAAPTQKAEPKPKAAASNK